MMDSRQKWEQCIKICRSSAKNSSAKKKKRIVNRLDTRKCADVKIIAGKLNGNEIRLRLSLLDPEPRGEEQPVRGYTKLTHGQTVQEVC